MEKVTREHLATLSQQAEPVCDTCHGQGEVWTGENQSFGYMSMQPPEPIMEACPECGGDAEPAPAQDGRLSIQCPPSHPADSYKTGTHVVHVSLVHGLIRQHDRIVAELTRPAQTEQQPATAGDERGHDTKGSRKALGAMNAKLRAKIGRLERELAALSAHQSAPERVSVPVLNKTREQWQKIDAKFCVMHNSSTANFHLIRDAQQDIERLHRALLASSEQEVEP